MNRGFLYAFLLALQFGIQPLLFKRFVGAEVQKFSLIVVTELCKILIAALSLVVLPRDELSRLWHDWSLTHSLSTIAPPAVLYAIQNVLVQASYQHKINSMMFNLLNQTKTLSAALWIYLILGKGQSRMQIVALVLLLISALVLNLEAITSDATTNDEEEDTSGQNIAVACVIAASMISGLSAALTQKVLTEKSNALLVSAQLAAYGILFLVVKEILYDRSAMSPAAATALLLESFWAGWDYWAILPVLGSALGGIVIGLVTKHAGSIMKGFALIFGLIVTGLAQWALDGVGLKRSDWLALGLVSFSIYLHTSFPLVVKKTKVTKTE